MWHLSFTTTCSMAQCFTVFNKVACIVYKRPHIATAEHSTSRSKTRKFMMAPFILYNSITYTRRRRIQLLCFIVETTSSSTCLIPLPSTCLISCFYAYQDERLSLFMSFILHSLLRLHCAENVYRFCLLNINLTRHIISKASQHFR